MCLCLQKSAWPGSDLQQKQVFWQMQELAESQNNDNIHVPQQSSKNGPLKLKHKHTNLPTLHICHTLLIPPSTKQNKEKHRWPAHSQNYPQGCVRTPFIKLQVQLPHLIWADADLPSAPPETKQWKDDDQSIWDPTSCKIFTTYCIFPASHPVPVQPWVRDAVLRWSLRTFLCLSDHIIAMCEISWRPLYNESMGKAIQTSTFWTLFDWWLDSY